MRSLHQIRAAIRTIETTLAEAKQNGPPPADAVQGIVELNAAATALRWAAGGEETFTEGLEMLEASVEASKNRRRARLERN